MGVSTRTADGKNPDGGRKHSRVYCLGILVVGIILSAVLIGAGLLAVGFSEADKSPKIVEPGEIAGVKPEVYPLSQSQKEVRQRDGEPHTFAILFYTVEDSSGERISVRDETWTYFNLKKIYQFVNGELQSESPLPAEVTTSTQIPCKPEQFVAGMSLKEIVAAIHLKQYLEIPLEDELVADSRLYYANRLTFALQNGKLRYIETLPLEGVGK